MNDSPVLITGGGQRAGLHLARRFMGEGRPVVVTYRREQPVIRELSAAGAVCIQADFSDSAAILQFIDALRERVGSLRAIIHNASTWTADAEGEEAAERFLALFHVHMQAPYLINKGCRDLLLAAGETADIIHLTDDAVRKGSANHAAYVATKAGLDNLTRSFAAMYAPQIKVNTIAPALLAFNDGDDEDYRERVIRKSVLGIVPGFDVIYQTVAYLMDNPYITAATIPLNGGRSVK